MQTRLNGPETWPASFPAAQGKKQSPIDIPVDEVKPDQELSNNPLQYNYDTATCTSLLNTGNGWRVEFHSDGTNLSGGPLEHNYKIVQFHCHWGPSSERGSEHTLDGQPFPGELHIVHWNADLYSTASTAVASDKGIAVVALFLKVGSEHPELKQVTDLLDVVTFRDCRCDMAQFSIASLLPEGSSYWTYEGSLTTPPCHESVTWIIFKEPLEVSEEQLESFRKLCSQHEGQENAQLLMNYRPVQPLEGRIVREPETTDD